MELGSDLAEKLLSHDLMCVDGAFTSHQGRTFSQRAIKSIVEQEVCLLKAHQVLRGQSHQRISLGTYAVPHDAKIDEDRSTQPGSQLCNAKLPRLWKNTSKLQTGDIACSSEGLL